MIDGGKHICVIAGEPSGDFLGGKLIESLRSIDPDLRFTGVGGYYMRMAGTESLFSYEQLAVMGIAEVLPRLPQLLARIRQTIEHIKETKPDVVVTIDSPDFSFRVAKAVRREMVNPPKIIHYVAPTVWAWREGRAEKISRCLDGLVCLFDFEPRYFEKHGLRCVAAGHPMVEGDAMKASGARFREEFGILHSDTVVGALFGSRKGEIRRTGPYIRDAIFRLADKTGSAPHIVAPTLPHIERDVMALLRNYPGPIHVFADPAYKFDAFRSFNVAIATSGTVGLELAALEVPHLIAYRMNAITAMMVKRLVRIKYAHLANIMADREVVPEFIQHNCVAERMADKAFALLNTPAEQRADFADIKFRLGFGQKKTPSQKAAEFVLSFVK